MDLNLTTDDFKTWLRKNRETLADRTPDEIASLAHFVGFSHAITLPILSHFEDALRGSNFDNKAKMHIDHETLGIELLANPFDMHDQWIDLGKKLTTGEDWDEGGTHGNL